VTHVPTNARLTGDILLISSSSRKSANTSVQTLLRFRRASFSHVAIVLDATTAIHAMPDEGVHLVPLAELLRQIDRTRLKTLRHLDLDRSTELQMELREALLYFHNQRYNKLFFARLGEGSSYCSELAAKAYRRIGKPLTKRLPRNTLPEDLAALSGHRHKWIDATGIYADDEPEPQIIDSIVPGLSDVFASSGKALEEAGGLFREGESAMHEIIKRQQEVQDLINTFNEALGLPKKEIKQPREYWDAPGKGKKGPTEA